MRNREIVLSYVSISSAGFTQFNLFELKAATNDFSERKCIGKGSFCNVYKVRTIFIDLWFRTTTGEASSCEAYG